MLGDLPFVLLLVMAVIVDEFDAITSSNNWTDSYDDNDNELKIKV